MIRVARLAGTTLAMAVIFSAATAAASTSGVVISQVYGGGGNSGATYKNDFIELFNAGPTAVSLNGWSVQYASASGSSWSNITSLSNVTLQPGQYFLIEEAGGSTGANLPIPDQPGGTINLSASNGKVALVSSTSPLTGTCPLGGTVVDFVGFGNANCSEGGTAVSALSTTLSAQRKSAGCTDTDNNSSDFNTATPAARNGSTPLNPCGGGNTPTNPSGNGSALPAAIVADGTTTTLLSVAVTAGSNPTSTGLTVSVNLSAIGGSTSQTFYDDGTHGDVTNGDGTFSFLTSAAVGTTPGSKTLPATITDAQSRSGSATISLSITPSPISIMAIQGHGAVSPKENQLVATSGVVTAVGAKGFFMQDPTGDGDPSTSDGLYVYTGAAPSVAVGNVVNVSGTVKEFSGSTEITSPSVLVTATSGPTVAPYVLDDHPPTNSPTSGACIGGNSAIVPFTDGYQASNFACLDGMLVSMNEGIVTGATYASGGADAVHSGTPSGFYAALASQPRPARGPGVLFPGISGHPEIPVWGGEPQVLTVFYKGLGFAPGSDDPGHDNPDYDDPSDFVYHAGTTFSVTGVIQGYQPASAPTPIYELYPRDMTTLDRATAAENVKPVADVPAGMLSIGSQNFLHMFNNVADGSANHGAYNDTCTGNGADDSCPTAAQYQIRRTKWATQICDVLKAPVVLAVQEIENRNVLADLAQSVQQRCGTQYVPYLIQGNDPGGINLGILARDDVNVSSVTQLFLGTQTVNCSSGASCTLNDRPPLLMQATWNGYAFALLSIYNRSMSGLPAKPYVGPKRAEQAAQVAQIVQAWQSGATLSGAGNARQAADGTITQGPFDLVGDANVPLIVAGDFNAYQFSDGYADVTGMIMGTADPGANLFWFNGNAANADTPNYVAPSPALFDTGVAADPAERYSFNFSGYTQEIDHILLTQRARPDFVSVSNAHGNSDTSEASGVILNDLTAGRSGDHDGQVAVLVVDRIFANGFDGPL